MGKRNSRRRVSRKVPIVDEENKRILQFRGDYEFLSNFYECPNGVEYEGVIYPTAENAYQASKVAEFHRRRFVNISPTEAKKLGRKLPLLYKMQYPQNRIKAMRQILKSKFDRNPKLKEKLLQTKDYILVEGNTWGDEFWGVNLKKPDPDSPYGYKGENWLGRLLMEIRDEYLKEQEQESNE